MVRLFILNGQTKKWLLSFQGFDNLEIVKKERDLARSEGEQGLPLLARLILKDVAPAYSQRTKIVGVLAGSEILRGLEELTRQEQNELYRKMANSLKETTES